MGRLIDADKLIEEMRKWYFDSEKQESAKKDCNPMDLFTNLAITTVHAQPTAYDPDKVEEQLNDRFRVVRTDEDLGWNKAIDEAITIVKGGGVDDSKS